MNKEEIKKRTDDKVKAIKTLADSLNIEMISKQMISTNGFINSVIYFLDKEKYPEENKVEIKNEEKNDKNKNRLNPKN